MQRKLNFKMDVNVIDEWGKGMHETVCSRPFRSKKEGGGTVTFFLWGDANVLKSNIYKLVNKCI